MYHAVVISVLKRTGSKNKNGSENDFAARLKALRVQRNLAQTELAAKAGISSVLVSRYERGVTKPTAENLKRISSVLQISSDYLLGGKEEGAARFNMKDHRVLHLYEELESLPPAEKSFILTVLERLLKTHKFETLASKQESA